MKLKIAKQNYALSQNIGNHPPASFIATFSKHVEKLYLEGRGGGGAISKECKVTMAKVKTHFWHCAMRVSFSMHYSLF